MGRPRLSSGWVALAVTSSLAAGCAAHQPPAAGLSATLVKGLDGSGGVAWPGDGPAGGSPVALQADVAAEFAAGPRGKFEARDAEQLETADARLKRALEEADREPSAGNLRAVGEEYRRLGVLDQAYSYLRRAIVLDPSLASTREAMARLWRDWGLPAEGLGDAYRAVSADPDSPQVENTVGTVLFVLGHVDGAVERFERVLELDAEAAYARNNLCFSAIVRRTFDRAEAECRAALAIDPTMSAARNNLGVVLASRGKHEEALEAFRSAAGDEATAQYNLGVAYFMSEAYGPAAEAFETALARRPSFELARTRAREAHRALESQSDPSYRKR